MPSDDNKKLNKINLLSTSNRISELFKYINVGQLNDQMLNIVKAENRTLDFHTHEESDEMFYIIEGKMQIEFKDRIVDLNQGDFIIVPKGILHRPICKELVKTLLIEKSGTLTNENSGGTYHKQ
jgi:mannose-6-phosphate isomerase-like protein (cupin superfamily)